MEYDKNLVLMEYRNLKDLTSSKEFKKFIEKYSFSYSFLDNRLILISHCLIMQIHSFVIENIVYFDIYTKDAESNTNVDRLLKNKNHVIIKDIYSKTQLERQTIFSKNFNSHPEVQLKAEQFFFCYLELMDELLSDFFNCNMSDYMDCFTPTFEYTKKELIKLYGSRG
jgi:hypothetical protein